MEKGLQYRNLTYCNVLLASSSTRKTSATLPTLSKKEIIKKSEPRSGAPSSKKLSEMTAKRIEKRENAKEARNAARQAAQEQDTTSTDASKDTDTVITDIKEPGGSVQITKETISDNEKVTTITTTTLSITAATVVGPSSYSYDKAVANVAPPHLANESKKQEKVTSVATNIKTVNNTTTNNNSTSSSVNNSSSSTSTLVKEKDKINKEKEKLKKESEVKLT